MPLVPSIPIKYRRLLLMVILLCPMTLTQGEETSSDHPRSRPLPSPPTARDTPPDFVLPPARSSSVAPYDALERHYPIAEIVFEGNTAFSDSELQQIAQPFSKSSLTIAELEELRQRLTHHYIDHGYINSGALILPDALSADGRLYIRIVEGRLDKVVVHGQEGLRAGYIINRLQVNDTPFNLNTLQDRYQLLLTDPLIERMNGRLLPGSEAGHTVLDVDIVRARPYQITLLSNNYRPPSIGAEGGGGSAWVRNVTGLGDVIDVTVQASEGGQRYSGGWMLPISDVGTQIYVHFDEGQSAVIEEPVASAHIKSLIHNIEGGLIQRLVENLQRRIALGASLATRENQTSLLGRSFSFIPGNSDGHNQTTVARFYQEYTERWSKSALALRSTFSSGLNALGATPEQNPHDPDSEFFAWLGQAQYAWQLFDNGGQLVINGALQKTDDPLLPLERFSLGGVASVRGFRENKLVRDEGFNINIEFHYPLLDSSKNSNYQLSLIPFMDYGQAWSKGESSQILHSIGVGLNGRFYRLYADFYWAHPLSSVLPTTKGNLQDEGIHFQLKFDVF